MFINTKYYLTFFKVVILRGFISSLEQDSLSEKVSDSSLQFNIEGCDLDLMEKLLKETHGCDLYHYDACDI
jgi:hypothetical protein